MDCFDYELPWYQYIVALGQDDKAGIPCSSDEPVSATTHNICRAFVHGHVEVSAADHDFTQYKIAASVTSTLNIGFDPGKSFFSGGGNG